ncbi:MAG: cell division protein FtsZ [bacterium]|nr:cell division protein FtsZ [bacterium]
MDGMNSRNAGVTVPQDYNQGRDTEDFNAQRKTASIKVIGVGGAGCNAVNSMIRDSNMREGDVRFVAINTDVQALSFSDSDERIAIGAVTTRGLGAGANPEIGRKAIEESRDEVSKVLEGTDMVFVTAGMGGGTGTGAAPVVAKLAREAGALTVAVVTKPFYYEGRRRMKLAEEGIAELKKNVDAIIVVPNDSLLSVITNESRREAFNLVDDVLRSGVQGIAEIITTHGEINVDFADVKTVMQGAGSALLGIGVAEGKDRAADAARAAISSPLWEGSIDGAKGVLFNIVASSSFTLKEYETASKIISDAVDPDAIIISGSVIDDDMDDDVRITVVATGFPSGNEGDMEQDDGTFSFGQMQEEISFGNTAPVSAPLNFSSPLRPATNSDDLIEPAILRRNRNSMGG